MTPAEVIREARNVLFERGWHQGHLRGSDGSVCIEGACRVVGLGNLNDEVWEAVRAAVTEKSGRLNVSPPWWNDNIAESLDDVLDVLDRAEKIAEASAL